MGAQLGCGNQFLMIKRANSQNIVPVPFLHTPIRTGSHLGSMAVRLRGSKCSIAKFYASNRWNSYRRGVVCSIFLWFFAYFVAFFPARFNVLIDRQPLPPPLALIFCILQFVVWGFCFCFCFWPFRFPHWLSVRTHSGQAVAVRGFLFWFTANAVFLLEFCFWETFPANS